MGWLAVETLLHNSRNRASYLIFSNSGREKSETTGEHDWKRACYSHHVSVRKERKTDSSGNSSWVQFSHCCVPFSVSVLRQTPGESRKSLTSPPARFLQQLLCILCTLLLLPDCSLHPSLSLPLQSGQLPRLTHFPLPSLFCIFISAISHARRQRCLIRSRQERPPFSLSTALTQLLADSIMTFGQQVLHIFKIMSLTLPHHTGLWSVHCFYKATVANLKHRPAVKKRFSNHPSKNTDSHWGGEKVCEYRRCRSLICITQIWGPDPCCLKQSNLSRLPHIQQILKYR